jgi:acetyl-CoA synthetase
MSATAAFLTSRDYLLAMRGRQQEAWRDFRWPRLERFNWALDYFDVVAAGNTDTALRITGEDGTDERHSWAELSERSNQVANALRALGARRGERVLLMLPNVAPLWETMLAAMKLGLVIVPTTTQLGKRDLADRMRRGGIRHIVADAERAGRIAELGTGCTRLIVGSRLAGWMPFEHAYGQPSRFVPDAPTGPAIRCSSISPPERRARRSS